MREEKIIGIIGALEKETAMIAAKIEDRELLRVAGMEFISGRIGGRKVVAATCGIGKVNAACVCQTMFCRYSPDCIINTGVAGGIKDFLKPLDVVISESVAYHDLFMPEGYLTDEVPADNRLVLAAGEACARLGIKYYKGRISSGDQFISDAQKKQDIIKISNPLCVEMEGAAVGHCSALNGAPFVVVRCVSDSADDGAGEVYYDFVQRAAEISSSVVLAMLETL
ncbi:MAG: 5'-methylthioadenosine/adenosylhomocysteine nucleosidase [Oscillospiraceae bacterium]|jgi:adenosylhomocysteine nucleosidase|nr:5'-methylthioadenosine/adenosylhomocysteine nucleosidase [Oscillospiraceae bacterium]